MTQRGRIAVIAPSVPPVSQGGIASAHDQLARLLKKSGYDVRVFTFADFGSARLFRDPEGWISRFGSPRGLARAIQGVSRVVWALLERSWTLRSYQTADVLKTFWGCRGIRRELAAWSPAIVVVPDQGVPALWLRTIKSPGQIWVAVQHHNPLRFLDQPEFGLHSPRDAHFAARLESRALGWIDRLICPSRDMATIFEKTFGPEHPHLRDRVEVIPNLIESELIQSVALTEVGQLTQTGVRIYIPSAGSRFKGSDLLLELLSRLVVAIRSWSRALPIEFYLSGGISEDQQQDLTLLLKQLQSKHSDIHFLIPGGLPHRAHLSWVARCSVCVSPTWIDNYSMALLEAQSLGLPTVSFDVGGNRDLVPESGELGTLVPRGDLGALVEATLSWLKRSHAEPLTVRRAIAEPVAKRSQSTENRTREFFDEIFKSRS